MADAGVTVEAARPGHRHGGDGTSRPAATTWLAMKRSIPVAAGAVVLAAVLLAAVPAAVARAHTETDLVAVPAGSEATVTLKPTHGCGASPTVAVRIRAPLAGARADDVEGWTATAAPDGDGNTVLEWTGGVLPTDQTGAFPVEFTVPDAVGTLMTFPAIQVCEDGQELAWISGDPADEFPAPRVLILAADAAPADAIDEVPLDAAGRDQLAAVVDVDNPQVTTTTPVTTTPAPTTAPVGPTTPGAATTPEVATTVSASPVTTPASPSPPPDAETTTPSTLAADDADADDDSSALAPILIGVAVVLGAVGSVVALVIWRRGGGRSAGVGAGDDVEEVGPGAGDA